MTAIENTGHSRPDPKPVTWVELRRRAICKRRYGRAGLTIRRWGGLSELVEESALVEAISSYREGKASAEEVAWAFVRARVAGHSPTFSWEEADLGRLITLVTECSEDPRFEAREPKALAAELVQAQDEEIERLRKFGEQIGASLRRSTESINALARAALAPHLTQWAASQTRALDSLSKAVMPSSHRANWVMGDPATIRSLKALTGDPATARAMKALAASLPTFQPPPSLAGAMGAGLGTLALPKTGFLSAGFSLPDSSYRQLARSLEGIGKNFRVAIPPSLVGQLTAKSTFQIGEVFTAARAAAAYVEHEGAVEEAEVLEAITAEAEQVAKAPSLEGLEQMIAELGKRLEESLDEQDERRRRDRDVDWRRQLVLWFIAIYISYYIALHFYLGVKPGP